MDEKQIKDYVEGCVDAYCRGDLATIQAFLKDCTNNPNDFRLTILEKLVDRFEDGNFWQQNKHSLLIDELAHPLFIKNYKLVKFPKTAMLSSVATFIAWVAKCNEKQVVLLLNGNEVNQNTPILNYTTIEFQIKEKTPPYTTPSTDLLPMSSIIFAQKDLKKKLYDLMKKGNEHAYHILSKLPSIDEEIKAMYATNSFEALFPENNKLICLYRLNYIASLLQKNIENVVDISKRSWDFHIAKLTFRNKIGFDENDQLFAVLLTEKILNASKSNITARFLVEDSVSSLAMLLYEYRNNEAITYHLLNIIKMSKPAQIAHQAAFLDFFVFETSDERQNVTNLMLELCNMNIVTSYINYIFVNFEDSMTKSHCFLIILMQIILDEVKDLKFLLNCMITSMYKFMPSTKAKLRKFMPPSEQFVDAFVMLLDKLLDRLPHEDIENSKNAILDFFANKIIFSDFRLFPVNNNLISLILKLLNQDNCHIISRFSDKISQAKMKILSANTRFSELMNIIRSFTKQSVKFYPLPSASPNVEKDQYTDIKFDSDKLDFAKQYYDMLINDEVSDIDYLETMIFNTKIDKFQIFANRFIELCLQKYPQALNSRFPMWFYSFLNLFNDEKRVIMKDIYVKLVPVMDDLKEVFKISLFNIQRIYELSEKGEDKLIELYFEMLRKIHSAEHFDTLLIANTDSILSFISLPRIFLYHITLFLDDIFMESSEFYQKFFETHDFDYILNLYSEQQVNDHETLILIALFLAKIVPPSDFVKFIDSFYMQILCLILRNENIGLTLYSRIKNNIKLVGDSKNIMNFLLNEKEVEDPSLYFIVISTLILENYPDFMDLFIQKQIYLKIYKKIVDFCIQRNAETNRDYFYSLCDFLLVFNTRFHSKFFTNNDQSGNAYLSILGNEYQQNPAFPAELISYSLQVDVETSIRILDLLFSFAILTFQIIDQISNTIPSDFISKLHNPEQVQKAAELLCFCIQNTVDPVRTSVVVKNYILSNVQDIQAFVYNLSYLFEPFFDKKNGPPPVFMTVEAACDSIFLWSKCPISISSPIIFVMTHRKYLSEKYYDVWIHNIVDIINITFQSKNYSVRFLHDIYVFKNRLEERYGISFGKFEIEEEFLNQLENINSKDSNEVITMFVLKKPK